MSEVSPQNRLNELTAKEWLKFTKTWFMHNPSPRKKNEILHPAKYPEDMIENFIKFFSKTGALVFDPFLGTGSTLVACHNSSRNGVGIELQKKYADIAIERIKALEGQLKLNQSGSGQTSKQLVIEGNSKEIKKFWKTYNLPKIDLLITSPPYGPMLNKKGLASKERENKGLDTKYSEDEEDLGNAKDYENFLIKLMNIFVTIKPQIKDNGHLVVILQNYMNKGDYKMLAWDFAREMAKHFQFRGERIWLQDNKTLYPYGYKYSFVPNVHHHYCLIFKKLEEDNSINDKKIIKKERTIKEENKIDQKKEKKKINEEIIKKDNNSSLEFNVPNKTIEHFKEEVKKKIKVEGWAKQGRNTAVKEQNFLNAWTTEYAFKELLSKINAKFSTRAQYIGDAKGAGPDFTVEIDKKEVTIGIRSIGKDSLEKWKEVTYPNDRFEDEPEKIADYHAICINEEGKVKFFGVISKEDLLEALGKSEIKYSKKNQEKFRKIPITKFNFKKLKELINSIDKV